MMNKQVKIFGGLVLSIFTGVGVFILGMNTSIAQADTGCGDVDPLLTYDQSGSAEIVYQINLARRAEGLAPYKMTESIMTSAAYHANDMSDDDYFEPATHDVVDGELVKVCPLGRRIESFYGTLDTPDGADAVNIVLFAGLDGRTDNVMETWMGLDSTRGTILAPTLREIGVGQEIETGLAVVNTVAEFVTNADYFPLVIDNEAAEMADKNTVELYVYGSWDEIRIRENGENWSEWMPFSNEMMWDFSPVPGQNEIEAEMRSGSVTTQASDTIIGVEPTGITLQNSTTSPNWLAVAHTMIALLSAGMVALTVLAVVVRANIEPTKI